VRGARPIAVDRDPQDAALAHAERLARDTRCVCRSPLCGGRDSADWLSCESRCQACTPRPFQPPARHPAVVDDPTPAGRQALTRSP
jgi:hypothetical protein